KFCMPESRYVLLIEGRVQRGGFRSFLKKRALMLGITGYAENLPSGDVVVVLEGDENAIEKLIEVTEKEAPVFIEIERITKRKEDYTGSFADFERKGADVLESLDDSDVKEILLNIASYSKSTDEKLEKGVEILGEIKTTQDEHVEITKEILNETREISTKQDEHIELTKEILNETREISTKEDEHIGVTRKGFKDISHEMKGYRDLHEEIRELRSEFARLKEALRDAGISVS
ncbi:acylphosphatase, partial [Candidatus Pyrohabitans sp.]